MMRQQQQRIVPLPLPRPPILPRHLDKVILNHRITTPAASNGVGTLGGVGIPNGTSSGGGSPGRGRTLHPSAGAWPTPMTGLSPGVDKGGESPTNGKRKRSTRRNSTTGDEEAGPVLTAEFSLSPIGGDDNSVLPLPSHSVVNHLATSAIRNGVLAVGSTTRYKAKVRFSFLTRRSLLLTQTIIVYFYDIL